MYCFDGNEDNAAYTKVSVSPVLRLDSERRLLLRRALLLGVNKEVAAINPFPHGYWAYEVMNPENDNTKCWSDLELSDLLRKRLFTPFKWPVAVKVVV